MKLWDVRLIFQEIEEGVGTVVGTSGAEEASTRTDLNVVLSSAALYRARASFQGRPSVESALGAMEASAVHDRGYIGEPPDEAKGLDFRGANILRAQLIQGLAPVREEQITSGCKTETKNRTGGCKDTLRFEFDNLVKVRRYPVATTQPEKSFLVECEVCTPESTYLP